MATYSQLANNFIAAATALLSSMEPPVPMDIDPIDPEDMEVDIQADTQEAMEVDPAEPEPMDVSVVPVANDLIVTHQPTSITLVSVNISFTATISFFQ